MRGQTVEEVAVKTEYTSAVSYLDSDLKETYQHQETGAVLREEEIGRAFQFGNEATIRNLLEPNWWEASNQNDQEEQQQVADTIVQNEQERRRRIEAGEEEEEEVKDFKKGIRVQDRVVARTRVSIDKPQSLTYSCNSLQMRLRSSSRWDCLPVSLMVESGLKAEIKIIGFQSPENLNTEDNIKHSYFLYPDEEVNMQQWSG
jgi:ATP-dependent DNA helicase 2 subunit 1